MTRPVIPPGSGGRRRRRVRPYMGTAPWQMASGMAVEYSDDTLQALLEKAGIRSDERHITTLREILGTGTNIEQAIQQMKQTTDCQ